MVAGLLGLAGLAVLVPAGPARALVPAPAPLPDRVALAECVVVGQVIALEEKTVPARPHPGAAEKSDYKVAVVKIADAFRGAKGLTHLRIGFVPPSLVPPGGGGRPPLSGRFRPPELSVGQEACFFLTPHFEETFYVLPMYYDLLARENNPTFAKDVALVKRCARLLDDPTGGLKSRDAEERLLAAALLLARYRTPRPGSQPPFATEPIDAEQSRLILRTLAEADWTKVDPETRLSALQLFYRLGLRPEDGWVPPRPAPGPNPAQEVHAAAKQWLKANAATYRIQRFVAAKADKPD
jgi:hypothetical protein